MCSSIFNIVPSIDQTLLGAGTSKLISDEQKSCSVSVNILLKMQRANEMAVAADPGGNCVIYAPLLGIDGRHLHQLHL